MRKSAPILALLLVLAVSCGPANPPVTTPVPASPTILPSETATVRPTFTVQPPTPTFTPVLIEGTLTIKVNVRSGPGTSFASLGQLEGGKKVQILSKDKSGSWYQILYEPAPQGRGWVTAQYVQVAAGTEIPLDTTATPTGPTAVVTQRLNVRSGPATTFDSLGMLEPHAVVSLTGKNATASWLQIDYPSGPGGRGWITAQYVQTEAAGNLPVLDDYGTPVAATPVGTPAGPAVTPTATVGPAYADGDSQTDPAVQVTFSADGTREFTYSSQVSAPQGDPEDWVEFTPYAVSGNQAQLLFSLSCSGNSSLDVELWQGGSILAGWGSLACGEAGKNIRLAAGKTYELRLTPAAGEALRLVDYTLMVQNRP